MKKYRLTIRTIKRGAPFQGRPGNILINDKWFSSVEWRNNLLGAELPLELPVSAFPGVTIEYKELIVTEEMLVAGGGMHKQVINGREVTFKKVGTTNVEMIIDFSSLPVTENTVNIMKIKNMFPTLRGTQAPPPPAVRPTVDEVIAEPTTETNGEEVTEVHDETVIEEHEDITT